MGSSFCTFAAFLLVLKCIYLFLTTFYKFQREGCTVYIKIYNTWHSGGRTSLEHTELTPPSLQWCIPHIPTAPTPCFASHNPPPHPPFLFLFLSLFILLPLHAGSLIGLFAFISEETAKTLKPTNPPSSPRVLNQCTAKSNDHPPVWTASTHSYIYF